MKFQVIRTGGSIGESKDRVVSIHDIKEQAKTRAKMLNQHLSKGERAYYKLKYTVEELK